MAKNKHSRELARDCIVEPGSKIDLKKDFDPGHGRGVMPKEEAAARLEEGKRRLAEYQDKLYAQNSYALLIIFQALDAAGKDGTIKHVMSGLNPQGCEVHSFKAPSTEELDHDYLWRCARVTPERGRIGIFNRSYYEETLVVRVHPELLERQHLPPEALGKGVWKRRFEQINHFEQYLVENGIVILKFFLNVSREEQKKRFLKRIDRAEKNWKFSAADAAERLFWDDYMDAYEDCLNHTSTKRAPWYVIPADYKPFMWLSVAAIIHEKIRDLRVDYPKIGKDQREELLKAKTLLEQES